MGAIRYLSNFSKSMAYTAVDVVKDMNPAFTSFAETNREVGQIAYRSIREFKQNVKTITRTINENEYTDYTKKLFRNAWSDIKSGNWYNKERLERAEMAAIDAWDDSNPFIIDDDDEDASFDSSDDSSFESDQFLADSMDEVGSRTSAAISTAVLRSAELQTQANANMHKKSIIENRAMYGGIRSDLGTMNLNLANLVKFNADIMHTHVQNSTDFYTNQTALMTETRDILKEMLEIQKSTLPKSGSGRSSSSSMKVGDIIDSNGMLDIAAFGKYMYQKANNSTGGAFDTISSAKDIGMLDTIVAAPMKFVMESAMKKMIAPSLEKSFQDLNKAVGGAVSTAMIKATKMRGDLNPIKNFIGNLLGIDDTVTKGYDVSGYNKEATTWTGKDHKALTEVIPTLLSSINANLGGEDKRYDYAKGKFVSVGNIKKDFNNLHRNAAMSAGMEIYYDYLNPQISDMKWKTKADEELFREQIMKVLETNFRETTTFEPGKDASAYGINIGTEKENEALMKKIEELFSKVPAAAVLQYSNNLVSEMQQFNDKMNELAESGDSIYNTLLNGSEALISSRPLNDTLAAAAAQKGGRKNNKNNKEKNKNTKTSNPKSVINTDWDAVALEKAKSEHPEYFESDGTLKDGYQLKNGVIEKTTILDKMGVKNPLNGAGFKETITYVEKPVTDFVNMLTQGIYNVFFPKKSESAEEEDMSFAQKIAYGISNYIDESSNKVHDYMDEYLGNLKEFFRLKIDQFKEKHSDLINGFSGGFKEGFKNLGGYVKNSFKDVGKWFTGGDDELDQLSAAVHSKAAGGRVPLFSAATGRQEVKQAGLYALSPGEVVTPPDGNKASGVVKRMKIEQKVIDNLMSGKPGRDITYRDTWETLMASGEYGKLAEIMEANPDFAVWVRSNQDTIASVDSAKPRNRLPKKMLNEAKNALYAGKNIATDLMDEAQNAIMSDKDKEVFNNQVDTVMGEIKENYPNFVTGGALGAGVSLLTGAIGGPLLGAAAGAGIGLLTSSEKVQKYVFGEKMDDGSYKGGMLPAEVSNLINKYAPNMAKGATVGAITSLMPFIPGGPVAGIVIGSSIGFATKNESLQKTLFGDDFNPEEFQKKVQKALPKMGLGAVAGVLAGPFGLATNAILGASLGFASDTNAFKNAIFGEEKVNPDGTVSREGGIYGAIKETLNPVTKFVNDQITSSKDWLKEKVTTPIERLISPLGVQIKQMFKSITNSFNNVAKGISKKIMNHLSNTKIGKAAGKVAKGAIKVARAPLTAVGWVAGKAGDKLRKYQLRVGTAHGVKGLETAEQRNAERAKLNNGALDNLVDNRYASLDQALAGMDTDQVSQLYDAQRALNNSKKYIQDTTDKQSARITQALESRGVRDVPKSIKKQIRELAMSGDFERAKATVEQLNLPENIQSKLLKEVEDSARKMNAVKDSDKLREESNQKLNDFFAKNGIKVGGKFGISNSNLEEILASEVKNNSDIAAQNEEKEKQEIPETIRDNTSTIVDILEDIRKNGLDVSRDDFDSDISDKADKAKGKRVTRKEKIDILDKVIKEKVSKGQEIDEVEYIKKYRSYGLTKKKAQEHLDKGLKGNGIHQLTEALKAPINGIANGAKQAKESLDNAKKEYDDTNEDRLAKESGYDENGNYTGRKSSIAGKIFGRTRDKLIALKHGFSPNSKEVEPNDNVTEQSKTLGFSSNNQSGDDLSLLEKITNGEKNKVTKSRYKYSYTSDGTPIKIKIGKNNEEHIDMGDAETADAINQQQEEKERNKSLFGKLFSFTDFLPNLFGKKDEEGEEKESIFSKIFDSIAGENGILGFFKNFFNNGGFLSLLKTAIPAGLVLAGLTGKLNNLASTLTGGVLDDGDDVVTVKDHDGNNVQIQTDENGNPIVDENGNYTTIDGRSVDGSQYVTEKANTNTLQSRLISNAVRGTVTGTGSIVGWAANKVIRSNKVTSTIADVASTAVSNGASNIVKTLSSSSTASSVADDIISLITKFTNKLKTFPKLSGVADKIDDLTRGLAGLVEKYLPKAGSALTKVSSALKSFAGVARIALAANDFLTGWQDANATLKITGEPTTGQKIYCGILRALKNCIPVLGTFIPDSAISDLLLNTVAKWLGIDVSELKKQQDEAQAEVEAYNLEHGTSYTFEEYNKEVLGNYTWTEKVANGVKSLGSNVPKAMENVSEALGTVKDKVVNYTTGGAFNDDIVREKLGLNDDVEVTLTDRLSVYAGNITNNLFGTDTTKQINGALVLIQDSLKSVPGAINNKLGELLGFTDEQGNPVSLTDGVKTGFDNAVSEAGRIWNGVKSGASAMASAVGDSIQTAKDKILGGLTAAGDYLDKSVGGLFGFVDEEGNPIGFTDGVSNAAEILKTTVTATLSGITEGVKSVWGTITDKFSKFGETVKDSISDGMDYLDKKVGSFFGLTDEDGEPVGFTDAVKDKFNSFTYALKNSSDTLASISDASAEKRNAGAGSRLLAAMGSGISGSGFISQRDPKYASRSFNMSGDTQKQTIGDTGCAPASAAMVLSQYGAASGGSILDRTTKTAMKYKVKNDGVTPDYFADEFAQNGLSSQYIGGNDKGAIKAAAYSNTPVVLMGQDATNKSKKNSPFGPNNHYVVTNGMSSDGKTMYINDPEAKRGHIAYPTSKILNSTKIAVAPYSAATGSGLSSKMRSALRRFAGRATDESIQYKVWTRMVGAGYSEYATAGAMGSIEVESGFNPSIIEKGSGAGFGLCQWTGGRRTQLEAFASARNTSPSDVDLQIDFLLAELNKNTNDPNVNYQLMNNKKQGYTVDQWLNATDITTAASAFCWTFERPSVKYAHLDRRIEAAKKYYEQFTGTPGVVGTGEYSSAQTLTSGDTSSSSSSSSGGTLLSKLLGGIDTVASLFGLTTASSDSSSTTGDSTIATDGTMSDIDTSSINGNVSSNPEYAAKQKALVAAMKSIEGKIQYSMQGPRDPNQGSADCSSTVAWAYKNVLGVDPGANTTAQRKDSDTYTVATNLSDESKLQLGDLLLRDGHVEMYAGPGQMIGHGGPDLGPTTKNLGRHPSGKPYNLVRRWVGFQDAGSGSGLDSSSGLTSPLTSSSVSSYRASSNTNTATATKVSTVASENSSNSNNADTVKALLNAVLQIAQNTSYTQEIVSLLVKLVALAGSSEGSSNNEVYANEIANIKTTLAKTLSNSAKQNDSTSLDSLVNMVEKLAVQ